MAWNQCSRRLHKIASSPVARARYFLEKYSPSHVLYYLIEEGSVCDRSTVDHLLSLGAKPSRYLFQCITLAYTKAAPSWIPKYWCSPDTIPFKHWLGLLRLGVSLYVSSLINTMCSSKQAHTAFPGSDCEARRWTNPDALC